MQTVAPFKEIIDAITNFEDGSMNREDSDLIQIREITNLLGSNLGDATRCRGH